MRCFRDGCSSSAISSAWCILDFPIHQAGTEQSGAQTLLLVGASLHDLKLVSGWLNLSLTINTDQGARQGDGAVECVDRFNRDTPAQGFGDGSQIEFQLPIKSVKDGYYARSHSMRTRPRLDDLRG